MKTIYINTNFEGLHKWDKAPEEVSFLRNLHRHLFKVRVEIEVKHNDRELEFFMFKDFIEDYLSKLNKKEVGSCEMIAEGILNYIKEKYPDRFILVDVSEDGENGAKVYKF